MYEEIFTWIMIFFVIIICLCIIYFVYNKRRSEIDA